MIYVWALATALSVTATEVLAVWLGSWREYWFLFVPLGVLNTGLVVQLVLASPSLLDAFIAFGLGTTSLRLLASIYVLDQTVSAGALSGYALVVSANILRVVWR